MTAREIAMAYFDARRARDAGRFRALLADEATWEGRRGAPRTPSSR